MPTEKNAAGWPRRRRTRLRTFSKQEHLSEVEIFVVSEKESAVFHLRFEQVSTKCLIIVRTRSNFVCSVFLQLLSFPSIRIFFFLYSSHWMKSRRKKKDRTKWKKKKANLSSADLKLSRESYFAGGHLGSHAISLDPYKVIQKKLKRNTQESMPRCLRTIFIRWCR